MTMPDFWSLLHVPTIEMLGWTLLHFVWQGALVAGVLAGALHLLRDHGPTMRYAVSCAALALLLALPVGTAVLLSSGGGVGGAASTPSRVAVADEADVTALVPSGGVQAVEAPSVTLQARAADWLRPAIPWVVVGWALGVLVFSLRLAGGAWQVRRLRRASDPAPDDWSERIRTLARRVGLRQAVPVRISAKIDIPLVAGWWHPVVLVPAGLVSGLPPQQVEALLLHELAHVRRHDVLVGRFQALVETLLFFHPATWWISREVRHTREACCDDLAVRAGTDRRTYAQALASLAERALGTPTPSGAVAATDGPLLNRVRRLLAPTETPKKTARRLSVAIAVALIVAVPLGLAACASQQSATAPGGADAEEPTGAETAPPPEQTARAEGERKEAEVDREEEAVVVFGRDSSDAVVTVRGDRDVVVDSIPGGVFVYTRPEGTPDSVVIRRHRMRMDPEWRMRMHSDSLEMGGLRITPDPDWFDREWEVLRHPDSLESVSFRSLNPDSLERSIGLRLRPDSVDRPLSFGVDMDTLELRFRPEFNADSLERAFRFDRENVERRAREIRKRADSMRVELRKKLGPKLEAERGRFRALEDSLEHELRARIEADTVRHMLRLRADSLARWHEQHADSLRLRLRKMKRRMERERPKRLREQARRLREQAEQLEERAREMEERPQTETPADTSNMSETGAELRYRDEGRFWMGPSDEIRPTTRFYFDSAPTGWSVSLLGAEYTV